MVLNALNVKKLLFKEKIRRKSKMDLMEQIGYKLGELINNGIAKDETEAEKILATALSYIKTEEIIRLWKYDNGE
jgi:tRNA A-37 threonylcarbamoyl transferase component Bud32